MPWQRSVANHANGVYQGGKCRPRGGGGWFRTFSAPPPPPCQSPVAPHLAQCGVDRRRPLRQQLQAPGQGLRRKHHSQRGQLRNQVQQALWGVTVMIS